MKRNTSSFWVFFIIAIFLGCERDGRVGPSRTAGGIIAGSDGVRTCWFQYVDFTGQLMTQPGVRMEAELPTGGFYMHNNGVGGTAVESFEGEIHIESNGVTNEAGRVIARGHRDWQIFTTLTCGTGALFRKPNDEQISCEMGNMIFYEGPQRASSAADSCATMPVWSQYVQIATLLGLTEEEVAALTQPVETLVLPKSGFSYEVNLVQQKGSLGYGKYSESISEGFMACNIVDVDDILLSSYPMQYSYIVRTAGPTEIDDDDFYANVQTDSYPDGVDVGMKVIAQNAERTVHIIRTDYFIAEETESFDELMNGAVNPLYVYDRWTPIEGVDPNDPNSMIGTPLDISDPNFIINDTYDPNRMEKCWIVPMEETGDYIQIKVEMNDSIVIKGATEWLQSDSTYDINGDNIVNLLDFGVLNQDD